MATNTSSPTPSEDNRQNNRDDVMYSALDNVLRSSEQSYDDFLNSFTYLKQGSKEKHDQQEKTVNKAAAMNKAAAVNRTDAVNKPTTFIESVKILTEGDSSSRMTKTKVIKTGSLVKFDNFVDPLEDSLDDMEELAEASGEGYTASFSEGKFDAGDSKMAAKDSKDIKDISFSDRPQEDSDTANANVSNMLDSKLSLDEKSTDKLLMNFLADLQNELNEGKTNDGLNIESTNSHMDIQNFLDKNKNQREQSSEEVNFDDDDETDAVSLLQDDSEKGDVKVKITEEEFNKVVKSDAAKEEERRARIGNIYRDTLMDSEGKVRAVQSERNGAEHNVVDIEIKIDADSLVFPGQVEEMDDPPATENDTLLDFKATYRETTDSTATQMERTDDLIQPFQLDKDFDYDNVILAPKYSSQDLQQLKKIIKPQAIVM